MDAVAILTECFPAIWRVAHALGGSDRAGRIIVQIVVRQSLDAMPNWRAQTPPLQWFYHHTVLAARRHQAQAPDPTTDPLVEHAGTSDPAYIAFIRAVRLLPQQQREAYLLRFGERLDDRSLGISMDCSTGAAQKHLAAALAALAPIASEGTAAMIDTLANAYQALTPEQVRVGPQITAQVARANARRWIRRTFRVARALILLGILAAGTWYFRSTLMRWYELARSMDRPAETQPTTGP